MLKTIFKATIIAISTLPTLADAQFRTRNRMDNLEDFDEKKYSWGFYLVGNHYDYKLVLDPTHGVIRTNNSQGTREVRENRVVTKSTSGFGAGLIGRMRLHENLDLRLEPSLQFVQRDILFKQINLNIWGGGTTTGAEDISRTVKSTYIDIPLMLEIHGDRWYNSRPYAAVGGNYLVNLQSNQTSESDNVNGIFRSTTHNFGWSAEVGLQFYFRRFKLTPGFRGTFFLNNELVRDNDPNSKFTKGLVSAHTRAFMFVLKFE